MFFALIENNHILIRLIFDMFVIMCNKSMYYVRNDIRGFSNSKK